MQPVLVFENAGELDPRFLSTFGCSVKESDNPIGWFGTGLKFAIAVLLRTGHSIRVLTGTRQLEITTRTDTLRGQSFAFVCVDGEPAGFTTELGKNWELWMAYRELYCNTKDEPAATIFETRRAPRPAAGCTRILVQGSGILQQHARRGDFLLAEDAVPDFVFGEWEVFARPSRALFYRGVKVAEWQREARFTYNKRGSMQLTEDRTAKCVYTEAASLSRELLRAAPKALLQQVLLAPLDSLEHSLDYDWPSTVASPEFLSTVGRLQQDNLVGLNPTAVKVWRTRGGGKIKPTPLHTTAVQQKLLERAVDFCERRGFGVRQYPIVVVETLGAEGVMALADRLEMQILLAARLLEQGGVKHVARALIEEYLHLKFNYSDCSRELQNYLFDKLLALAEELHGEPL